MIVLGDQIQQLFHPNLSEPSIKYSRSSEEAISASVLVQCLSGLSGEHQTYPEQCSRGQEHRLQLHPGGPRGLWRCQLQPHHVAHLLRTTETMLWDQLCVLQNTGLWAFKNIAPFSTQYPGAVDELMKLTQLFVSQNEESSEDEIAEIRQFR